jgi:thioredoxin reductase (NADPH)
VERTNVPHIYAVGDIVSGVPELQTVAAKSGKFLAHRISHRKFGTLQEEVILKKYSMDYSYIPTTVFSPVEYSYVGLNEEEATERYGADNIECYLKEATPL